MAGILLFATPVKATAPVQDFEPKAFLAQYTLDPRAFKTVSCESGWHNDAVGDHGLARTIVQFHEETFYRMQRLSGLFPNAKWGDERAALAIFAWATTHKNSNGVLYATEWSCWK